MNPKGLAVHLRDARAAVEQTKTREKLHTSPAGGQQLLLGKFEAPGLSQYFTIQHRHLVGADNQCVGVLRSESLSFCQSEPLYQRVRRLVRLQARVNTSSTPAERQPQAFENLAPIGRAGRENKRLHG